MRGLVRIKSFTDDPADVAAYGPAADETGERRFALTVVGLSGGMVLAEIEGVTDRESAEALRGTRLYVARAALPAPEADEFYHDDLLGLAAVRPDGSPLGRVVAVHPGAPDALELDLGAGRETVLVPFTREVVPEVDVAAGRVVVDPPAGLIEEEEGSP